MTTRAELEALAERVEREEPSRELDALVCIAVRARPPGDHNMWVDTKFPLWRPHRAPGRVEVLHHDGLPGVHWEARAYTTSLDAAVTLVPSGALWWVGTTRDTSRARVYVDFSYDTPSGNAATPAAALTAAALRARAMEARND